MNILIDENIPFLPEILARFANVRTFRGRSLMQKDIKDFDAEVLLVRSTTVVNEKLLHDTNVRIVGTATSGSDHFDQNYLDKRGIIYFDAIGSNALSVAEYCTYGILNWAQTFDIDLSSKTLGIIGFGNVGRRLAKIARLIGLNVVINDPPLAEIHPEIIRDENHLEIGELIDLCDIITTHVPLTFSGKYKTYNLLDYSLLKQIKPGALLLHTSRGGVVCEQSWMQLTKEHKFTAIVDVWGNEPKVDPKAILSAYISTPHIAGHSYDAKIRGALFLAKKLANILNTKIDTSFFENIIKENKKSINDLTIDEIYNSLKLEKQIEQTSNQFKEYARRGNVAENFEQMRRYYPKVREIFLDDFFE